MNLMSSTTLILICIHLSHFEGLRVGNDRKLFSFLAETPPEREALQFFGQKESFWPK